MGLLKVIETKLYPLLILIISFVIFTGSEISQAGGYPQRIVSLGPINTENIYLLGAEERLVANTVYCVRPEAARTKEKIGSVMQVSIEKIISLHPDLVLATGLTQPEQVNQMRKLGLSVIRISQPVSFSEICKQFKELGKLLGLEQRAREEVRMVMTRVDLIRKKVASLPEKKVFLQIGSRPLFGAAPGSFVNDYIVMGGGSNVIGDQTSGVTTYEKVIFKNPDVIIIAMMGSETGVALEEKKKWMRFKSVNAVKSKAVYMINPDLVCSPSPETFVGTLEVISGLIHGQMDNEK